MRQFRPDLPSNTTFALQTLDGGENPQGEDIAGSEAVSTLHALISALTDQAYSFLEFRYPVRGWNCLRHSNNFHFGWRELRGWRARWFLGHNHFLLNENSPPQVLTTSYGVDEPDVTVPLTKYVVRSITDDTQS